MLDISQLEASDSTDKIRGRVGGWRFQREIQALCRTHAEARTETHTGTEAHRIRTMGAVVNEGMLG